MAQIKFKAGDKLEWRETSLDDTEIIDVNPQRVYVVFRDKQGNEVGAAWFSSDMLAQFSTIKKPR